MYQENQYNQRSETSSQLLVTPPPVPYLQQEQGSGGGGGSPKEIAFFRSDEGDENKTSLAYTRKSSGFNVFQEEEITLSEQVGWSWLELVGLIFFKIK